MQKSQLPSNRIVLFPDSEEGLARLQRKEPETGLSLVSAMPSACLLVTDEKVAVGKYRVNVTLGIKCNSTGVSIGTA